MTISQQPKTLDEFMALPWTTEITPDPDGGVALTVWPIADFVVYGEDEAEVRSSWREALRSHLGGYLAVGKHIPTGRLDVSLERGATASSGPRFLAVS